KLPTSVLTDATRTHPTLAAGAERWLSPAYTDPGMVAASCDVGLSPVPPEAEFLVIGPETGARAARVLVHDAARAHGLAGDRLAAGRLAAPQVARDHHHHNNAGV